MPHIWNKYVCWTQIIMCTIYGNNFIHSLPTGIPLLSPTVPTIYLFLLFLCVFFYYPPLLISPFSLFLPLFFSSIPCPQEQSLMFYVFFAHNVSPSCFPCSFRSYLKVFFFYWQLLEVFLTRSSSPFFSIPTFLWHS